MGPRKRFTSRGEPSKVIAGVDGGRVVLGVAGGSGSSWGWGGEG